MLSQVGKIEIFIRKNIEAIQFYTKPWIIRIPVSSFVEFRYCEGITLLKKNFGYLPCVNKLQHILHHKSL